MVSSAALLVATFFVAACAKEAPAQGTTADDLVQAAARGDLDLVSRALSSGIHIDATDTKGMTALQSAAAKGHAAAVRALLGAGADVDLQFKAAWSALAFAAEHANNHAGPRGLDTVTTLLDAGANPMLEDLNGYNAQLRADAGTPHHGAIEARVRQIAEEATPCVLATGEECSDEELAFAEKWQGRTAEEIDAQVRRLGKLLHSTAAGSINPERRKWFRQRLNVLSQIQGMKARTTPGEL
jgi:hypothetical protein